MPAKEKKGVPQSAFPDELDPREGFAQPKGFKKGNFQPRDDHPRGDRSGFKPGFKPGFAKGKPAKFAKGFKKDHPPR